MLQIDKHPLAQCMAQFSAPWHVLLRASGWGPDMAPEWLSSTAHAQDLAQHAHVWTGHRAGQLVSLLPYLDYKVRMHGIPLRMWELPGGKLVTYHQDLLATDDQVELLRKVLLAPRAPWHVFLAPALLTNGATARAVADLCAQMGWILLSMPRESSPFVPITGTWQEFLATKSSNFRYNLNRKERGLQKAGQLIERWFTAPHEVDELQKVILEIEAKSWKVAAGMATSDSMMEKKYYALLLPFLAARKALFANVLTLGGTPVAYSLCYFWNGKMGQMKTSFDEAISGLSPGLVVNYYAVRKAFELKATEFDFLGDVMPHKVHWTSELRQHEDYYVFSNRLRAQVTGRLKQLVFKAQGARQHLTLGRGAQAKK